MLRRVMMAGQGAAPFVGTTWDPAVLTAGAALASPKVMTVSASGGYRNTRSAHALAGNCYFAIRCARGTANNYGAGVADAGVNLVPASAYVGAGFSLGAWFEGRLYYNGASAGAISGTADTSDIQIAVRVATRRVWMRVSGGAWFGGGDPAADTAPTLTIGGTGALYAAATIHQPSTASGASMTLLSTPAEVTGAPPAGFSVGIPGE